MSAAAIANQLPGRKSGLGWVARCPAHDDRTPSLSLREEDGKILVHCHAGCEQSDVVEALMSRGLWPEKKRQTKPAIVATYDYTDEMGDLLYQVVRMEPKRFLQRYPDRRGGWVWKKFPYQVIIYASPGRDGQSCCGSARSRFRTIRGQSK